MGSESASGCAAAMIWLRLLLVVVVVSLLGLGIAFGPQSPEATPELPAAGEGPYLVCPGAVAGGGFVGRLGVYADDPTPGRVTVVGPEGASTSIQPAGLGGATIEVGDLVELGDTPLYVEASGQMAAATLASGTQATALTGCLRAGAGPMAALGIATTGTETASIQLVNPFAQDANLRLELVSELGTDTPGDLEGLRLPAATHIELALGQLLTGRESVSVKVEVISGLAAMSVVRAGSTDVAASEAVAGANQWYLPLLPSALSGQLHIRSLSTVAGDYRVDRIDVSGTVQGVAGAVINPGEQVVLSLADLGITQGGVVVEATEPVVVALVIQDGNRRAIMPGGILASRWAVPVSAKVLEGQNQIWIFNPGDSPLIASIARLDAGAEVSSVEVAPGAAIEVLPGDIGGGGILVESDGLMVVAFGVVNGEAIGLSMAIPLG